MSMETTALYCRVSTEDQDLKRQKEETWEYAHMKDFPPQGIEVYEDKATGTDTERVGYQELLADVRADEIDHVVVLEISRFSRSMRDLAEGIEQLLELGVSFHVASRGLDLVPESGDPMHKAFVQIMGVFAELEVEMTRERIRSGIQAAKREGKWVGNPPYGFSTSEDGFLVPVYPEFEMAVEAIGLADDGESYRRIARHTGISRPTVKNIVENKRELYLDEGAEA